MAQTKLLIPAPIKGYSETSAYNEQPDGTSPDMRNVMVWDVGAGRVRVATRPGIGLWDGFDYGTAGTFDLGIGDAVDEGIINDTDPGTTIPLSVPAAGGTALFMFTLSTTEAWSVIASDSSVLLKMLLDLGNGMAQLVGFPNALVGFGNASFYIGATANASGSDRTPSVIVHPGSLVTPTIINLTQGH